jgi:hypothetical protein
VPHPRPVFRDYRGAAQLRRRCRGDPLKKLRSVARAWASPGTGDGAAEDDDPNRDAIEAHLAQRAGPRDDDIDIHPDEQDSVALFFALASQWRWHPMAGARTGLDYAAVAATATMAGIAMTPARFADLRIMEGAALAVWNR